MATLKTTAPATWTTTEPATFDASFIGTKYTTFADNQKSNHTLWFLLSLMIHGVFLVPMIGILTYFYTGAAAPFFLATSLICFFTSLIANMGGSGIRTTLLCFAGSAFVHFAMAAIMLF